MGSTLIRPGFRGFAEINTSGELLRFASCSLNASQDVEAPDLVMGDETHNAWAYGKIDVAGTISGPVTESLGAFLLAIDAQTGTASGVQINVKYYDGYDRSFTGCQLQSFSFTVTAGEVVQFNLNIIGETVDTTGTTSVPTFTKGEKLVTWDKAVLRAKGLQLDETFSFSGLSAITGLQSFTFEANNNITRQFIVSESSLFGDLVEGMKAVTGSISSFVDKSSDTTGDNITGSTPDGTRIPHGADFWDQYLGDYANAIEFDIGADIRIRSALRFHRGTTDLSPGPVVTTINFTGVTTFGKADIQAIP
jgi:hypothetical protein